MLSLRDDQQAVVNTALEKLFATNRPRLLLAAPTGWGKTVAFCYIARHCANIGLTVTILAHRAELIAQIERTLNDFDISYDVMAAGRWPRRWPIVSVASVQTLARRLGRVFPPDVAIIDEAHHAISRTAWGRILAAWPNAARLGVTATPLRLSGEGLNEIFDELIYGPSVAELIASGRLSPFRIYAPPCADTRRLHVRAGDFQRDELSDAFNNPKIIGDAVDHYRRLAHGKRAIAFCVSIQHAISTANAFREYGYSAENIDGTMDPIRRHELIEKFKAGAVNILTSCDLISEGFDCPAIEAAILLRPTMSVALYLQQVGRALRTYPGKEEALILDHAGNTLRHGFPDELREWSLEGVKKNRGEESEANVSVKVCKQCFAACRSTVSACPHCGYVWPTKPRRVEEAAGELRELQRHEIARRRRREQGEATELQALISLGESRGYRRPEYWAKCVWSARMKRRG